MKRPSSRTAMLVVAAVSGVLVAGWLYIEGARVQFGTASSRSHSPSLVGTQASGSLPASAGALLSTGSPGKGGDREKSRGGADFGSLQEIVNSLRAQRGPIYSEFAQVLIATSKSSDITKERRKEVLRSAIKLAQTDSKKWMSAAEVALRAIPKNDMNAEMAQVLTAIGYTGHSPNSYLSTRAIETLKKATDDRVSVQPPELLRAAKAYVLTSSLQREGSLQALKTALGEYYAVDGVADNISEMMRERYTATR